MGSGKGGRGRRTVERGGGERVSVGSVVCVRRVLRHATLVQQRRSAALRTLASKHHRQKLLGEPAVLEDAVHCIPMLVFKLHWGCMGMSEVARLQWPSLCLRTVARMLRLA